MNTGQYNKSEPARRGSRNQRSRSGCLLNRSYRALTMLGARLAEAVVRLAIRLGDAIGVAVFSIKGSTSVKAPEQPKKTTRRPKSAWQLAPATEGQRPGPSDHALRSPYLTPWTSTALALVAAGSIAHAAGDFQFFSRLISIPERGEVTGYFLLLRANRLSFIPPAGWQLKYEANRRVITLTPSDYAASVSVCILPTDAPAPTEPPAESAAESLQKELLKRYPGARMASVQPCYLGDYEGLAFELERTTGQGAKLVTRVCLVTFPGGVAEFCLTTTPDKLKEYGVSLNVLMSSFEIQSANSGQEPPPVARS